MNTKLAAAIAAISAILAVVTASVEAQMEATSTSASDINVTESQKSPFRFTVDVSGGYDDNFLTSSSDKVSTGFTGIAASVSGVGASERSSLGLNLSGGYTYYFDTPGDDSDWRVRLGLDFQHRLTNRLAFSYSGFVAYEIEPDFSAGLTNTRRSGYYIYSSNNLGLTYAWTPTFSTVTRYNLNIVNYEDFNRDDRFEQTFIQEFRYLWRPATTAVAEYRLGLVDYDSGISESRDSLSHFVLAGVDHQLGPRSRLYFRGGVEIRDYDGLGDQTVPYGELNIDYDLAASTVLSWANRYSIEESWVGNGYTTTAFRTGLRLKHSFSQQLHFNTSIYYVYNDYEAALEGRDAERAELVGLSDFTENSVDATVGLEYFFTRQFSGFLNYTLTNVSSGEDLRDYSRNRVGLGLRATF